MICYNSCSNRHLEVYPPQAGLPASGGMGWAKERGRWASLFWSLGGGGVIRGLWFAAGDGGGRRASGYVRRSPTHLDN